MFRTFCKRVAGVTMSVPEKNSDWVIEYEVGECVCVCACILGLWKNTETPAEDRAHALLMWGTFSWFTDDKSTGRVESVVRVSVAVRGASGILSYFLWHWLFCPLSALATLLKIAPLTVNKKNKNIFFHPCLSHRAANYI